MGTISYTGSKNISSIVNQNKHYSITTSGT